jgi:hypothetical protein
MMVRKKVSTKSLGDKSCVISHLKTTIVGPVAGNSPRLAGEIEGFSQQAKAVGQT